MKVLFLTPNVTSLIHFLCQEIIQHFKRLYRHLLLTLILENIDEDETLLDFLKKINLTEAYTNNSQNTLTKS